MNDITPVTDGNADDGDVNDANDDSNVNGPENEGDAAEEQSASSLTVVKEIETILETIQDLPEERRQPAEQAVIRLLSIREFHSGPIPPASELAKYEQVEKGTARLILGMAETEQKHRHTMDHKEQNLDAYGLGAGLVVGLTALVGGIYLIGTGHDATGFGVIIAELGALVGVFVYVRNKQEVQKDDDDDE